LAASLSKTAHFCALEELVFHEPDFGLRAEQGADFGNHNLRIIGL